jgi:hypothetical protein
MAKFLDTQAISNELMRLIKEAKERIVLISYSFKVNPQIQERLKTKSKIGTLSEIVIVYGKTELKQAELEWIKEIQDLKIYEKSNLHAKCYLNEDRAIICSMNLYDYSQQNNIEMGILITKSEDGPAYQELIDEINNIKINGTRKTLEELSKAVEGKMANSPVRESNKAISAKVDLTYEQKLRIQLLQEWRFYASKSEKTNANQMMSDAEILKIVTSPRVDKNVLYEILPKKNAIRFAEQIIDVLGEANRYTIGHVLGTWYQTDESKYDRVKLKILKTEEEKWFDTTQELPSKDSIVAVKLNNTWFNQYFYI